MINTRAAIYIEMFPAKNGDCLLIRTDSELILIDCGYPETYTTYLKPRLQQLAAEGKVISRFIVTHIDDDHIAGAIKFLEENGSFEESKIIHVGQIWHNSYRHIAKKIVHGNTDKTSIALLNSLATPPSKKSEGPISAQKGSTFAALVLKGKYPWNEDAKGEAICIDNLQSVQVGNIKIHLLSPSKIHLERLEKFWAKELYKAGFRGKLTDERIFDDAFEYLMIHENKMAIRAGKRISASGFNPEDLCKLPFEEDDSKTNGSSIALMIESYGKKALFLADSFPSIIFKSLCEIYGSNPILFDAIKISHHGSRGNSSPELLSLVDSPKYLISTDGGKHNHPDLEALARIITRECEFKRILYFNYPHEKYKTLNRIDLKEQWNYDIYAPTIENLQETVIGL